MPLDLNDPEVKTELKKIVDAAVEESTEGLKKKNTELLNELKEARKGKQVDPAELERIESKLEEVQGQLAEANKQNKKLQTDLEKANKTVEVETGITKNLLADNGLTEALVKAKIAAPFLPAVKALLLPKITIKVDGETRKALVGDKELDAFVTEWAGTDEGKHYVGAPVNGGGGSGGSGNPNPNTGKTMTRQAYEEMISKDPLASSKFFKEGGKLVEA